MDITPIVEVVGIAVDVAGVAVIVGGIALATVTLARDLRRIGGVHDTYKRYRRGIGRAILLGLEFLVAADIIRTVAIEPTLRNASVLAIIVLIRTFLSLELETEIEGRWPWQRARARSQQESRLGQARASAGSD